MTDSHKRSQVYQPTTCSIHFNKNPIDNKLTQHILDPSQDSHSCQLATMGAHQCYAKGAHTGLTTAMPRDTLTYNKNILIRRI